MNSPHNSMHMHAAGNTPDIEQTLNLLESVIDPEAGISVVDMGLIYDITPSEDGVFIKMTMTSAACPMGDLIAEDVERCLRRKYPPPARIDIEITFDPPWDPSMMSESARSRFGW